MRLLTWFSLALMLCGLLAFYYFGQTLQIHCYRLEGRSVVCATQVYWLDLFPVAEAQLFAPATNAFSDDVCTSRPDDTEVCSFFVFLEHESNSSYVYPLEKRFFNQSTAAKTAEAINQFIASDTIFVDVYPSDKITLALTSCIGLPFFLLGAIMLWAQFRGRRVLPSGFE